MPAELGLPVVLAAVVAEIGILADDAGLGCLVRSWALASRNPWRGLLLEVHHATSTFERVPPEAVGVVLGLVDRRCALELPLRDVCVL